MDEPSTVFAARVDAASAQAPDEDVWKRVQSSVENQAFLRHVGARLECVGPGSVEIGLSFQEALTQQHGFVHGGVIATLADVAAGYAAYTVLPDRHSARTADLKVSFLAPAQGSGLVARGTVVKAGRLLIVCRSDVYARTGGTEKLCATALATFASAPDSIHPERGDR